MSVKELDGIELGSEFSCMCGVRHAVRLSEILVARLLEDFEGVLQIGVGGDRPVLLVTGPKTRNILGERVARLLEAQGYSVVIREVAKCDLASCAELETVARECKLALAVGGGSVIDACKLASHNAGVPFISMPTTISHDGVASPIASVFIGGGRRASIVATPPVKVVFITEVVRSSPPRHLSAGCGDILAKNTSLMDWLLGAELKGEYFCDTTFEVVRSALREVLAYIEDSRREIERLFYAAVRCGLAMGLVSSSRPCSGAEHLFSHYIDLLSDGVGMHGEQVGIGAILMAKRYEDVEAPHAGRLEVGSDGLRNYLERAGAPTRLRQIRVATETALRALLEGAHLRPERHTILHHAPLTRSSAAELLRVTGVSG